MCYSRKCIYLPRSHQETLIALGLRNPQPLCCCFGGCDSGQGAEEAGTESNSNPVAIAMRSLSTLFGPMINDRSFFVFQCFVLISIYRFRSKFLGIQWAIVHPLDFWAGVRVFRS